MSSLQADYRARRVYETTPAPDGDGSVALRLKDRMVDLGAREFDAFKKVAAWLPTTRSFDDFAAELGMDEARLARFLKSLEDSGLVYRKSAIPPKLSGKEFHAQFNESLRSWLDEAFSHPFWERMMSGKGSSRLFSGWMIELYHYTLNANRHMPLSCAHTPAKNPSSCCARRSTTPKKWNHYHYFMKSLKALGYRDAHIEDSLPLPMTLALSNFMRQAAREDVLAYSICSAVLEGTTTDRGTFNPYYEKSAELYDIPREAINPIYAHLDLDVQYQHSDLFLDI